MCCEGVALYFYIEIRDVREWVIVDEEELWVPRGRGVVWVPRGSRFDSLGIDGGTGSIQMLHTWRSEKRDEPVGLGGGAGWRRWLIVLPGDQKWRMGQWGSGGGTGMEKLTNCFSWRSEMGEGSVGFRRRYGREGVGVLSLPGDQRQENVKVRIRSSVVDQGCLSRILIFIPFL